MQRPPPQTSLAELKADAERSTDAEVRARWLLGELISPGGDAARAKAARQRLDASPADHYLAHFARVNEIMAQYVREPYPARAAVGVAGLPRGALVEIDAILHAG